jgi:hypothetical protein
MIWPRSREASSLVTARTFWYAPRSMRRAAARLAAAGQAKPNA